MDLALNTLMERVSALHGVAHYDEVVRSAQDRSTVAVALSAGMLQRPSPRLLVVPGTDPRVVKARQLRARLTCASAARVLGYPMWTKDCRLHLALPRNHALRPSPARDLSGTVVHRLTQVTALTVDGFPLVVPTEVVACCLRCLDELDAVSVADAALNRGDVSRQEVLELLEGRYCAQARRRLGLAEPATRSPLETRVRLALRALGLRVEAGVVVEGVGEVDLLVEGWLVVEADGFEFHSSPEQFASDRHRDQVALSQGLVPLRLTGTDVAEGERAVQGVVARALLGAAHSNRMVLPEKGGVMRKLRAAARH